MLSLADGVGLFMLVGALTTFVVLMVRDALAGRRHRRVMQQLAEELLASGVSDDADGPQ